PGDVVLVLRPALAETDLEPSLRKNVDGREPAREQHGLVPEQVDDAGAEPDPRGLAGDVCQRVERIERPLVDLGERPARAGRRWIERKEAPVGDPHAVETELLRPGCDPCETVGARPRADQREYESNTHTDLLRMQSRPPAVQRTSTRS